MAFWGAEVKPGKPVTHSCEKARGRLRISQATLGFGEDSKKSVVQCNVGNRRPVLFCALLPGLTESCHLDLEFEEADDVVFSVLGPRSVFLTGYYLRRNRQSTGGSDTESYGVDIENSQTAESSYNSDDNKYEGSFIDDDDEEDLQVSPGSPAAVSQGLEEVMMEEEPKERNGRVKSLKKKKYRVVESDDDVNLLEKEDKNGFSLSLDENKRDVLAATCDNGEKTVPVTVEMDVEAKDDGVKCNETKQNADKSLRKKHRVIVSDDGANLLEKEDKNGFSLSLGEIQRDVQAATCDTGEKTAPVTVEMDVEAKDDGVNCNETKQNADPLRSSDKIERVSGAPLDEEGTELINGNNELLAQVQPLEGVIVPYQEVVGGSNTNSPEKDQTKPLNLLRITSGKSRMKRKRRTLFENTSEVPIDNGDSTIPTEHKEPEAGASTNLGIVDFNLGAASELDSVNGPKLKKIRSELLEGDPTEGTDEKSKNITADDLSKPGLQQADGVIEHQLADCGEYERQQKPGDSSMKNLCVEYNNVQREDGILQEAHADSKTEDLAAESGKIQKDQIVRIISSKSALLANGNQLGQKIKKKKKRTKDSNMSVIHTLDSKKYEGHRVKIVAFDKRTLSNGLTIVELRRGPPGGKVALPGKNVKIYYSGMLKESGHVFDSNVGKAAFKFRLGDEYIIDGWNAGIEGMHVGDKRRLIIPPSMGFGDNGSGDIVPADAWLVYEIELVSVRR